MSEVADRSPKRSFNTRRRSSRQPITDEGTPKAQEVNTSEEYGFLNYKNVKRLRIGRYEFDTWFGNAAVFTEPTLNKSTNRYEVCLAYKDSKDHKISIDFSNKSKGSRRSYATENENPWIDVLYFCCYCFKFTDIQAEWECHQQSCKHQFFAPGKIMYDFDDTIIRRISGFHHKLFCQCMCLLAKFFLDNKSIFYYVDNFDFYVVYKKLDEQILPMGFYSRELASWENNNLSCICVFPCYQKHNLGTSLIDFSYALSKYEKQICGPEHPLSELGQIAYLKYWCRCIYEYIKNSDTEQTSLRSMSETTGIRIHELLDALSFMGILYKRGEKDKTFDFYSDHKSKINNMLESKNNFHVYIDRIKLERWAEKNLLGCSSSSRVLDPTGFKFNHSS